MIETATVQGARKSIDAAYTVAAEDRAAVKGDAMSDFHRRAAEIAISEKKVYGAAAHLTSLYAENPRDKKIAFELARHLRYVGSLIEAESVLNDALAIHGPDPALKLEQAKLFLAGGRAAEALPILAALQADHPDDPGILQASGLAHDRLDRHEEAQRIYAQAMALGRPSAALLNNAGLSHLITGDLDKAITLFRQGAAAPGATSQTRMNLAMALALKGETAEAERIAAGAAPEAIAQGAVEYYSSIVKPADAWSVASGG
jgi:Flp pilus assembly protein TadD